MLKELVIALCVVRVSGGGDASGGDMEALLGALGGVHGLNRASVCVVGEGSLRRCEGALVGVRWAVARPSCLLRAGAGALRVVRLSDGLHCADVEAAVGAPAWGVRRVPALVRPSPRSDLALLPLDPPYLTVDYHANSTSVNRFLKEWEPWMSAELHGHSPRLQTVSYGHKHMLLSTPMRMLATTVLLPMLSMLALFMFVVFCTGERNSVPYESIEDSEPKTDHSTYSLPV